MKLQLLFRWFSKPHRFFEKKNGFSQPGFRRNSLRHSRMIPSRFFFWQNTNKHEVWFVQWDELCELDSAMTSQLSELCRLAFLCTVWTRDVWKWGGVGGQVSLSPLSFSHAQVPPPSLFSFQISRSPEAMAPWYGHTCGPNAVRSGHNFWF